MLSIKEFKELFDELRAKNVSEFNNQESYLENLQNNMIEYLRMKVQEVSIIFKKFNLEGIIEFCRCSTYKIFENDSKVFTKGEVSKDYIIILHGDIQIIDDEESNKILKTISAGTIFGHKIKSNYTKTGIAKNQTHVLSIGKDVFDNLIDKINMKKEMEKFMFIKKYLSKIRLYSDDIIESFKPYFIKEDYYQNSKLFLDNEYDEYIYLVVRGVIGCIKSVSKIPNLKEKLISLGEPWASSSHVVLEKLKRGNCFGVYSALKHNKNNYSAEVLSEKASIYKIPKAHILLCFGGSTGALPNSLKGIDSIQQNSLIDKIEFLSRNTLEGIEDVKKFSYINNREKDANQIKIIVDESQITNFLKDAWKELENIESKVQNFKTNLFKPTSKAEIPSNILNKLKDKDTELKDHTKVMGFGTTRLIGKQLNKSSLSSSQVKGMNMLKSICDVRKQPAINQVEEEKQERKPNRLRNLMSLEAIPDSSLPIVPVDLSNNV